MDMYYALAEPNRRLILEQLALHGQMAASEIAEQFQVTASAISQHLKVLFEAGLVRKEKVAQKRIYSINEETLDELSEWAQHLKQLGQQRLDNLQTYLEQNT